MKIAIIDDDLYFLNNIEKKIKQYSRNLFNIYIDTFTSCSLLFSKKYDIYFLDIDMPSSNGIDIAKKIKSTNSLAKIIFITSHVDLVFSAITIQPFYFIRKTNLDKDLSIAFTLLEDCYIEKEYYKFKYNSEIVSILIDDILYLETSDHLTTIYTNLNQYHIYKSLKDIQEEIHSQNLIQINRKTIINILHISFDKKNTVTLDNKKTFKIGRTFKKNFNDAFSTFIFKGE